LVRHILEFFINKVTDKRQLITKKQKSYLKNLQSAIHHSQFVGKAFITEIKWQVKNLLKYNKLRNYCRKSVCQNNMMINHFACTLLYCTVHTKQSYNIIIILKGFFSPLTIIVNALENSSRQLTIQMASSFSVGIINFLFQLCF